MGQPELGPFTEKRKNLKCNSVLRNGNEKLNNCLKIDAEWLDNGHEAK